MKKSIIYLFLLTCISYGDINILKSDMQVNIKAKTWLEIKNKKVTRQDKDFSCGSAALSTILTYFYHTETPETKILSFLLRNKSNLKKNREKNGLSFVDLEQYIYHIKFKPLALAVDMYTLKKLQIPAILYIKIKDDKHFTVYKGSDSKYIYLADPSFGNIKISLKKFQKMFYYSTGKNLHAGMIMAILPNSNKYAIDKTFMKIPKRYKSTYIGLKLNLFR